MLQSPWLTQMSTAAVWRPNYPRAVNESDSVNSVAAVQRRKKEALVIVKAIAFTYPKINLLSGGSGHLDFVLSYFYGKNGISLSWIVLQRRIEGRCFCKILLKQETRKI